MSKNSGNTNLLRSTKRTPLMMISRRTWPTIIASVDKNARASIAARLMPSNRNTNLSADHVGP